MYLPYRAGADECYDGIELYIASLKMLKLHSRLYLRKQQQQQLTPEHWPCMANWPSLLWSPSLA